MPPPPILVLEHIACEPPAAYGEELGQRGIPLRTVRADDGELPDWRDFAAIVAMGGPMGAYEDERLPWLAAEKLLIAQAVAAGRPVWGVCLGAQLLAASLGARVAPGPRPEIGVAPVELTAAAAADPVFGAAPATFPAFHWHGDTYELPAGARRLAGSSAYEQQAFVHGSAYGVQFHLEVDAGLVLEWGRVPAYADGLARLGGPTVERLAEDVAAVSDSAQALARTLFARWLERIVGL
jgi:GMP synthase-like glutamine amidotransferase